MKEPLEASFLHRSRHLNPDLGGYRDHASAQAAAVAATAAGSPPVPADALVVCLIHPPTSLLSWSRPHLLPSSSVNNSRHGDGLPEDVT
jgi:hypothetical protein